MQGAQGEHPTAEHETVLAASAMIEPTPLAEGHGEPKSMAEGAQRPVLRLVRGDDELDEAGAGGAGGGGTGEGVADVYVFKPDFSDRRKHRRFTVSRPGKVFRRSTQQFQSIESKDLSYSGALLTVVTLTAYTVGEIVDVAVATSKAGVLPMKSMLQGVVVRAGEIELGKQLVAVRYLQSAGAERVAA